MTSSESGKLSHKSATHVVLLAQCGLTDGHRTVSVTRFTHSLTERGRLPSSCRTADSGNDDRVRWCHLPLASMFFSSSFRHHQLSGTIEGTKRAGSTGKMSCLTTKMCWVRRIRSFSWIAHSGLTMAGHHSTVSNNYSRRLRLTALVPVTCIAVLNSDKLLSVTIMNISEDVFKSQRSPLSTTFGLKGLKR